MSKTDAFSNLVTQLKDGKISLDEFKKSVGELDLSFDSLESQIDLSAVVDKVKTESGNIPLGGQAGIEEKASEFISAITTMDGDGLNAFLSNWGIESPSTVMAAKAAYIPQGAAQGIYNASGRATDAMTNLASRMILAARSVFVEYGPTAGGNAVIGLVNGAYEKIQQVYDSGYNIGMTFMQGYDNATNTRSPSREMMERGIYAVMGLVNGIRSEESYAVEAGYGIGTLLTDAVQEAMSQMALMATDDFAFSPIITPVVDMTNVDDATGTINSVFGREHHKYINSVISRTGIISDTNASGSLARTNQYNDTVIGEFRSLSDRINDLGTKIENMQIVLDTGVLVGSTSARMDNQLGKIAARRERAR